MDCMLLAYLTSVLADTTTCRGSGHLYPGCFVVDKFFLCQKVLSQRRLHPLGNKIFGTLHLLCFLLCPKDKLAPALEIFFMSPACIPLAGDF